MENVIKGKLKLKKPLEGITKKKKKSKSKDYVDGGASSSHAEPAQAGGNKSDSDDDPRTSYEKKWDKDVKKQMQKNARNAAEKTHRDRVNEFNEKLSKMSEHYDIPRVAGGG